MSRLHWIDCPTTGRLAIAARPRAGDWLEDEIGGWAAESIAHVVSLLEPAEIHDLGLHREAALCAVSGVAFVSFPIPDRGLPESRRATAELARSLAARLSDGADVLIHCRAGIGRSSLLAACVMIRLGVDAAEALSRIATARGVGVPDTEEQRAWVMAMSAE
ncbi:protein-tyrosine phosphatase family protein [Bradyrhizobium sp. HKCCYLS2038]|uniref:protein-tyrosine phosphatase family protein n=1 Tax=unclassified Bradyrhizobium TaxID=2631580 RepID=UPI003EBBB996